MYLDDPQTGLTLAAILPSLKTERGKRYHELVIGWAPAFASLDVPVQIIVPETPDFPAEGIEYIVDERSEDAQMLNAVVDKAVFGNSARTLQATLILYDDEGIVQRSSRINPASLDKMKAKAFSHQIRAVKSSFSC